MTSDLDRANQFYDKARKKLSNDGCGCFGESLSAKSESAISLYSKACIIYQREMKYENAAMCFEEVASIKERQGEDAYSEYQEAAYYYSFSNFEKTKELAQKCCRNYEDKGQFHKSGDVYENLAKHFEKEKDYKSAVGLYDKAAKSYSLMLSGYKSKEKSCLLKSFDLSCIHEIGDWRDISEGYTLIGKEYLIEPMLKYSAKELFFKVVCLYLLNDDYIQARAILNDFKGQDPSFDGSSEYVFLEKSIEAFRIKGKEIYEDAFKYYKSTNSNGYDEWKKTILNRIYKKLIGDNDNNCNLNQNMDNQINENDFLGGGNEEKGKVKNKEGVNEDDYL